MARPAVDKAQMRKRFAQAAEAVLRANGGAQLVLADVAAHLGMSQSNSYRYFPTRQALVSMLADTWFADIEHEVAAAVAAEEDAEAQLMQWVLTTMRAKCARFDADPILFMAYLNLAKGEREAVVRHVARLRDIVRPVLTLLTGRQTVDAELSVLEDATILFRDPNLIAQYRTTISDERAHLVTEAVIRSFSHR